MKKIPTIKTIVVKRIKW